MPYRRLPNTDAARIRALKAALKKGQYLEIDTIAYPFALKQKIEFFLPKFEVAITNSKLAKEKQFESSFSFDRTGFAAMGGKNNCRRAEPDQ